MPLGVSQSAIGDLGGGGVEVVVWSMLNANPG